MKKRLYAYALLTALAAAAVSSVLNSCSSSSQKTGVSTADTKAPETTAADTTASEETLKDPLPDNLDFGGKNIRILDSIYFVGDDALLQAQEATGDVVNDAVYKRNISTESKLNITFSYQTRNVQNNEDSAAEIHKSVMAGSDDYDLVFGIQYNMVPQVLNNTFMNLDSAPYLNLDQPWWYQDYIQAMSVGSGKTFFVTGDITLGVLRNMSCMYVNKNLYTQNYESIDDLYSMVLSGKWTFDQLAAYCTDMYQDLNGDGKADDDDRYGIGVITASLVDHFTYDAGIKATTRDENNIPVLTMNNEKTVNFTQKLYSLYYENPGVRVFPPTYDSLDVIMPRKFNANELLFLPGWFYTSDELRDMSVDYAIIPFPKYDENEPSYLSLTHDVSTIVCVPSTCTCLDEVCAVMEELAFQGYRDVLPAYYEVALKVKYVRDSTDAALQILDIIHDNATTDFAYIYNYALNGVGLIERELMGGKKKDFASFYTKKEKSYQKKLDALNAVFTDLG